MRAILGLGTKVACIPVVGILLGLDEIVEEPRIGSALDHDCKLLREANAGTLGGSRAWGETSLSRKPEANPAAELQLGDRFSDGL